MKKDIKKLSTWLTRGVTLFVFLLIGLGLGVIIANGITSAYNDGFFSQWKVLDGLRDFETIVDATSQEVWAKTNSGQLYYWTSNCHVETGCEAWVNAFVVPENIRGGGEYIQRSDSCTGFPFLNDPSGDVKECVYAQFLGAEFGSHSYYALTEDGRISKWEFAAGMIQDLAIHFFSVVTGLVLGLLAFASTVLNRKITFKSRKSRG